MAERIQLQRTKGWRKPEGAVVVARPTKWGNPHTIKRAAGQPSDGWYEVKDGGGYRLALTKRAAVELAIRLYREDLASAFLLDYSELSGHDLACWCPLDQPCHADVLLELANA